MQYTASDPEHYIEQIPEERKEPFRKLRNTILENLPEGFEETISYGMLTYVVPHSIFPPGYHVDPSQALPFISLASQKNFIAMYHMGLYSSQEMLQWFQMEYPKHCKTKMDMGKSCIRFKKTSDIPYSLIAELAQKISVQEWIRTYEHSLKR